MGKFKLGGHTLPGPNQKASVNKNLGIFKTTYDADGNKNTVEISPEEAADVKAKDNNMQRRIAVGNRRTNLTGSNTLHDMSANNQDYYTYTEGDAIKEIDDMQAGGQHIGGSTSPENYDRLRGYAQKDIDLKKSIKGGDMQTAGPDQATTDNTYGQQNSNTSTYVVDKEKFKNSKDRFGVDAIGGSGSLNPNLRLYDVDKSEQKRLSEEYMRSKQSDSKPGPGKNMKFGRKKK